MPKKKISLEEISPELKELVETKKLSDRMNLKNLVGLLKETASFDEIVDEESARVSKRATTWLIVTLVLGFLAFFTFGITLILALPALIVTLVYYSKKKKLKKIDLSNEFRNVLLPFLQTMSEDFHPKGRIKVDIDFAGPTEEKITRKEKIDPGRFKKVVETIYDDPWLSLTAPLADGGSLLLSIGNTYVAHDRYWRNPRGKSKHKTKWKKLVQVTAGLLPAELLAYDREEFDSAAIMEKMKLSDKRDAQLARLSKKYKFKKTNEIPEESVSHEELVGIFFLVASILKPASNEAA